VQNHEHAIAGHANVGFKASNAPLVAGSKAFHRVFFVLIRAAPMRQNQRRFRPRWFVGCSARSAGQRRTKQNSKYQ